MQYIDINLRIRYHKSDKCVLRDMLFDIYQMPPNPKVVVDIGGHCGAFAYFAAQKGAEVFSYEPEAENFKLHEQNIKGLNIHGFNCGVGHPGDRKLYVTPENTGGNSLFRTSGQTQDIKVISIHDVFKDIEHCDLLKMDCEGAEDEIIEDFDDELAGKIDQISMEYHRHLEATDKLKKWYNLVLKQGHLLIFKK